jgi:hypothetical protein
VEKEALWRADTIWALLQQREAMQALERGPDQP